MKILVINGPNINMLGVREPEIYGSKTYTGICDLISKKAEQLKVDVDFFQSNVEGEIITCIQNALGSYDGIIINPAAYTHYSIGILDALKSVGLPAIEVHISNIHKREQFRHTSVTVAACVGQICGLGINGYALALEAITDYINKGEL